jgi:tRNA (guanine-N7-)-methyltransferase
MAMSETAALRLYGRRKGKRLRRGQESLLKDLLPRIEIAELKPGVTLEPRELFDRRFDEVWLEIGFGGGEHLAALASQNPTVGFVGCDPFINGVAKLLAAIEAAKLENVRIYPGDGRAILEAVRPASIARVFALFPDPWPKVRHHKRRLIQTGSLGLIARALVDGGELRLATDDPDLADWMLGEVAAHGGFAGPAGGRRGYAARPVGWPATRYEAKALESGANPAYLSYCRLPRMASSKRGQEPGEDRPKPKKP